LRDFLKAPPVSGSTPPYYVFGSGRGFVPFLRTSAISFDFLNLNDLDYISVTHHATALRRSILRPFDVVYTMTGKFMGKAAIVPAALPEANISQNSVVLRPRSKREAAFLTLFLNSSVNRTQVAGMYTISKQKYLNQTNVSQLRVPIYDEELDPMLDQYLEGLDLFYQAFRDFTSACQHADRCLGLESSDDQPEAFCVNPDRLGHSILTPRYYSRRSLDIVERVRQTAISLTPLSQYDIVPGTEIGSSNYREDGIPFIKTSDLLNYDVDYRPDHYCSPRDHHNLNQDVQPMDLLLAKDGKVGETALVTSPRQFAYSSGLVRIRTGDVAAQLRLFVILSSTLGRVQLRRWTVVASTMAHLRPDFFARIAIPELPATAERAIDQYCLRGIEARTKSEELLCSARARFEQYLSDVVGGWEVTDEADLPRIPIA